MPSPPGFSHKVWKDQPDHTTPLSATAIEDLEDRVAQFALDTASALSGSFKGVWSSATTYALGDGVSVGTTNYISTISGNLNHNPVGDNGSHWTPAIPSTVLTTSGIRVAAYGAVGDGVTDDSAAITAARVAAEALGAGTRLIFEGRKYAIGSFHRFTTTPLDTVPGSTTFLALNSGAGVAIGAALGSAPTNTNEAESCGGFVFDGGGVATHGVDTNTVNWLYAPITVTNLAANADGFGVLGQNNSYERIVSAATGTGFCLYFDNGAGGNRIYGHRLGGGNHLDFRQTVDTHLITYAVPQDNVVADGVWDQPVTGTYCIRHVAGAQNIIRDCNAVHRTAAALVKYEQSTGYTGTGFVCGRLIFEGRTELSGNGEGSGQFAFWADFVTAGVAGAMTGDVALNLAGEVLIAGVDGEFKWGCTTPVHGAFCDVMRYPASTVRPFWTAVGTGALTAPLGILRVGTKTSFGGDPTANGNGVQVYKDHAVYVNGAAYVLRSTASNLAGWLSVGRTAEEGKFGVAGGPDNYFLGAAAGDIAVRQESLSKKLHLGVDNGASNIGVAAAELVIADALITPNAAIAGVTNAYREVPSEWGLGIVLASASVAGTYLASGAVVAAAGTGKSAFYLDPADFPAITGLALKVRVRGEIITNSVAPAINYTWALYPVATWGGGSNATPTVATIGAATATASAITTPGATTASVAVSADAAFPTAGFYVLAVVLSGTQATNAVVVARGSVEMRWA